MPTPIEIVKAMCAGLGEDGGKNAIRKLFTPETRWVNEGMSATTGIEEALAEVDGLEANLGIATIDVEILTIAAEGNRVLTERRDTLRRADGSVVTTVNIMGAFDVDGDKIVGWREYFDTAMAQGLAAG